MFHEFELKVTRQKELVDQKLIILRRNEVHRFRAAKFLVFCVVFRISLVVLFPLAIIV